MADPCQAQKAQLSAAQKHYADDINNNATSDELNRDRQLVGQAKAALDQCRANPPFATPHTNFAQAMVTVADYTYLFAVDLDGRILYNKWQLGGSGPGWHEVGGGGIAYEAPSAAVVAGSKYIFLTVKGRDGSIWLNQGQLNPGGVDVWVGWGPL